MENYEATLRESACWLALAYESSIKLERVKGIVSSWCLAAGRSLESLFHAAAPEDLATALTAPERQALAQAAKHVPAWQQELQRQEEQGIHLILRSHPGYPVRLTQYLPESAQPLFLFVQGAASLLDLPALGVIGGVPEAGQPECAHRDLGALLGEEGVTVHAGVGVGVVHGALSATGGAAILTLPTGICARPPDDVLDTALAEGRIAFISPFHPHALETERRSSARQGLIAAMSTCTLYFGDNGDGSGADTAMAALQNGCPVAVWQDGAQAESIRRNAEKVIEAGGMSLTDVEDVLDLIEALREEEQHGQPSFGSGDWPSHRSRLDPEAARSTLSLLAQAGRVPAGLAKRLGLDSGEQPGAAAPSTG